MRRIISVFIITVMLLSALLSLTTVSAAEPRFSTDKTVYKVGEPIMVTATSDNSGGTDWVGITPKDKKRSRKSHLDIHQGYFHDL